ncbi:MAG: sugar ABC transporter permease [Deinococcus sp.]|nr:sugar ABC transporter permease [Deinococcus sp.]
MAVRTLVQGRAVARRRSAELSSRGLALVMILPSLLIMAAVFLYPAINSLWLSLHSINLIKPWQGRPLVWLDNYVKALSSPDIWVSFSRTVYFTVVSVVLELGLGLLCAVLLNERFRGRHYARATVLVPWAMLTLTNALMWRWILHPQYGMLNAVLYRLGIIDEYFAWLSDPNWAMPAIILADVWKLTPFMTLLLLAGLQPIPDSFYEAAEVDGATNWQKFWYVVFPLLKPAILIAIVLRTVAAFKVFDLIYTLTNGGPGNATLVISLVTYREAFRYFHIGYGSALSWLVTLVILALSVAYIKALGAKFELSGEEL